MSKAGLEFSDLTIAPRKSGVAPVLQASSTDSPSLPEDVDSSPQMLPKRTAQQKKDAAEARAIAQEDVRTSLKNLKRSKERSVKFFINIALDYDLKSRLQRASVENDLKMTQVVKAALDFYLGENGY